MEEHGHQNDVRKGRGNTIDSTSVSSEDNLCCVVAFALNSKKLRKSSFSDSVDALPLPSPPPAYPPQTSASAMLDKDTKSEWRGALPHMQQPNPLPVPTCLTTSSSEHSSPLYNPSIKNISFLTPHVARGRPGRYPLRRS